MKFVIQRVSHAEVCVEGEQISGIDKGLLVFVGVFDSDTKEDADRLVKKLVGLRIFQDENDKTNLSLKDVKGSLLIVSQFTLCADCRRETGHPLSMPASRTMLTVCMSTSYLPAESRFRMSRRENSAPI